MLASQAKAKNKSKRGKKQAKGKPDGKKRASFKRGHGCKLAKMKVASKKAKGKRLSSGSTKSTKAPSSKDSVCDFNQLGMEDLHPEPEEGELDIPEGNDDMDFKGFSLEGIPAEAMPDHSKVHAGAFSYTVYMQPAGTIDVLLKKGAYYIKKAGANGRSATVSFKKHGGRTAAWQEAKWVGGFVGWTARQCQGLLCTSGRGKAWMCSRHFEPPVQ